MKTSLAILTTIVLLGIVSWAKAEPYYDGKGIVLAPGESIKFESTINTKTGESDTVIYGVQDPLGAFGYSSSFNNATLAKDDNITTHNHAVAQATGGNNSYDHCNNPHTLSGIPNLRSSNVDCNTNVAQDNLAVPPLPERKVQFVNTIDGYEIWTLEFDPTINGFRAMSIIRYTESAFVDGQDGNIPYLETPVKILPAAAGIEERIKELEKHLGAAKAPAIHVPAPRTPNPYYFPVMPDQDV